MSGRILLIAGLFCIGVAISAAPARAQVEGHAVGAVCADGSNHPAGFDCQAYLCSTGWAQAHGYASACGSSSTSVQDSGAGSALSGAAFQLGNALGNWLAKKLFGSPKPRNASPPDTIAPDANAARAAAAERERELELERQQQIEAARLAKFREEMHQLSLVWPGPKLPDETVLFRDTSTCFFSPGCTRPTLEYQRVDLSSAQWSFSDPLDQLRISACLSKMAAKARDPSEAKFLSDEAAKAMNGSPVSVDVSGCAPSGAVSQAALTPQQTALYRKLLDSTNREMDQLARLQEQKVKLETKKAELKKEIEAKQQLVTQLNQQAPPVPAAQAGASTPQEQSVLAEAEAELRAAQQQLSEAQNSEAQVDNEMKHVGDKLKANQACLEQAEADPSKAGGLARSCGQ